MLMLFKSKHYTKVQLIKSFSGNLQIYVTDISHSVSSIFNKTLLIFNTVTHKAKESYIIIKDYKISSNISILHA